MRPGFSSPFMKEKKKVDGEIVAHEIGLPGQEGMNFLDRPD